MDVLVLSPVWRFREERNALAMHNLYTNPEVAPAPPLFNDAAIDRSRSRGATWFLEHSRADVALWIDSDITFRDEDALAICRQAMEYGIVAGIYPTRSRTQAVLASRMLRGKRYDFNRDQTPQEILWAAGGFTAVHRRVYAALAENDPDCQTVLHPEDDVLRMRAFYLPMAGRDEDDTPIYLSEDWAFSERARALGVPSYANCGIRLGHAGAYTFCLEDLWAHPPQPQPMAFTRTPAGNQIERSP